jgi:hypothetical protein
MSYNLSGSINCARIGLGGHNRDWRCICAAQLGYTVGRGPVKGNREEKEGVGTNRAGVG